MLTTRVVVILLALAGAALAFGAPAFAARVTAKVYLGSRPVGCLIRYSTGDWDSPTVHLGKHGRDIRATAGMAERVGYARERPGGIWVREPVWETPRANDRHGQTSDCDPVDGLLRPRCARP